jgi:hypothetical protein
MQIISRTSHGMPPLDGKHRCTSVSTRYMGLPLNAEIDVDVVELSRAGNALMAGSIDD